MIKEVQKNHWVIIPRPNPAAQLRLFCLPFAGGNSAFFRDWADLIPAHIELCAIEIPGRGQRLSEPLMRSLEQLVASVADGIRDYLDKPFAIFGHSMGNLVGFELSHHLIAKQGKYPAHLFLSGRGAPHLPAREEPIHALPENDFLTKIREYNGTPKDVLEHKELMDILTPILRADFEVCETYQFEDRPKLECPLSILSGLKDPGANRQELEAWRGYTRGPFAVRMFPGDHFYMMESKITLLQTIIRDLSTHFNPGNF